MSIVAKKIKKQYNNEIILKDVTFNAGLGINVIKGENGSGKSTLLKIIFLQLASDDGLLSVSNTDSKNLNTEYYQKKSCTLVYQHTNFIETLSIKDNLLLSAHLSNTKDALKKIKQYLSKLNLLDKLESFPKELSGGELQRIAIVRGLINESSVILLDEPTSSLDSVNTIKTMELIKTAYQDKLVILVSHNQDVIQKYQTKELTITNHQINDTKEVAPVEINTTGKSNNVSLSLSLKLALKSIRKDFLNIAILSISLIISLFSFFLNQSVQDVRQSSKANQLIFIENNEENTEILTQNNIEYYFDLSIITDDLFEAKSIPMVSDIGELDLIVTESYQKNTRNAQNYEVDVRINSAECKYINVSYPDFKISKVISSDGDESVVYYNYHTILNKIKEISLIDFDYFEDFILQNDCKIIIISSDIIADYEALEKLDLDLFSEDYLREAAQIDVSTILSTLLNVLNVLLMILIIILLIFSIVSLTENRSKDINTISLYGGNNKDVFILLSTEMAIVIIASSLLSLILYYLFFPILSHFIYSLFYLSLKPLMIFDSLFIALCFIFFILIFSLIPVILCIKKARKERGNI